MKQDAETVFPEPLLTEEYVDPEIKLKVPVPINEVQEPEILLFRPTNIPDSPPS